MHDARGYRDVLEGGEGGVYLRYASTHVGHADLARIEMHLQRTYARREVDHVQVALLDMLHENVHAEAQRDIELHGTVFHQERVLTRLADAKCLVTFASLEQDGVVGGEGARLRQEKCQVECLFASLSASSAGRYRGLIARGRAHSCNGLLHTLAQRGGLAKGKYLEANLIPWAQLA